MKGVREAQTSGCLHSGVGNSRLCGARARVSEWWAPRRQVVQVVQAVCHGVRCRTCGCSWCRAEDGPVTCRGLQVSLGQLSAP